jgi:hydroxymethylbilane synthase
VCVACERALLEALGADCHSPVAALAEVSDGRIRLRAQLLTLDGSETVSACSEGGQDDAAAIAASVAEMLFAQASPELRQLFAG